MAKGKKDTGIYRSDDGKIVLPEEQRDRLAKINEETILQRQKELAQVKTPELMTSKELHDARWNGIKTNNFTGRVEVWFHGRVVASCPASELVNNPGRLAELLEEATGDPVMVVTDMEIKRGSKH